MRKAKWLALLAAIAGAIGFFIRRRKHEMEPMEPGEFKAA